MKNKEELIYQAEINAVDRHFNQLKILIPCGIATWPIVFSITGVYGVGGLVLLGLGAIGNAYRQAIQDWRKIKRRDRATLYDLTR